MVALNTQSNDSPFERKKILTQGKINPQHKAEALARLRAGRQGVPNDIATRLNSSKAKVQLPVTNDYCRNSQLRSRAISKAVAYTSVGGWHSIERRDLCSENVLPSADINCAQHFLLLIPPDSDGRQSRLFDKFV